MKSEEFTVLNDKLDHVIEYMEKRFDDVDKHFDNVDKRFVSVDKRTDSVISYMEKQFEKNDEAHDKLLSHIDYLVGMTQKLDQERLFGFARVNRLEKDVIKIKKHLNLT